MICFHSIIKKENNLNLKREEESFAHISMESTSLIGDDADVSD